jgi:hypothetical protein
VRSLGNMMRRPRRGSASVQIMLYSSLPLIDNTERRTVDDDDPLLKRMRRTRSNSLVQQIKSMRCVVWRKGCLKSSASAYICTTMFLVLICVRYRHGYVQISGRRLSDRSKPMQPLSKGNTSMDRLDHRPIYGETSVSAPVPLDGEALDEGIAFRYFGGLYIDMFEASACPEDGCKRQIYHDPRLDYSKQDVVDPDEGLSTVDSVRNASSCPP